MKDFKFLLNKVTLDEYQESTYEVIETKKVKLKNKFDMNDLIQHIAQLGYDNGLKVNNVEITEENSRYYQAWFDYKGISYLVEVMGKGYD